MASIQEIVDWLRDPKNGAPDTDNVKEFEPLRERIADAFDLKPSNKNIDTAFVEFAATPRAFRRVAPPDTIIDQSRTLDLGWIEESKKRGRNYWPRLERFLLEERKRSQESVYSLDDESETVLRHLGDPRLSNEKRKGLVVGYVQSGKTANMAALMTKAADAGYKLFIVFAGVLDTLRQQTQLRMDQELTGQTEPFQGPWSKMPRVKAWRPSDVVRNFGPGTFALPDDVREGDISDSRANEGLVKGEAPILYVIKKTPRRLALMRELIEKTCKEFGVEASTDGKIRYPFPTLIIDDESDQATINILSQKGDIARTNKEIRALLSVLRNSTYIGYTATPFANLLIDPRIMDDELGKDLFPDDFIVSLRSPPNYFGARQLFGLSPERDPEKEHPGLPVFRPIDEKEVTAAKKIVASRDLQTQLPQLGYALYSFILSCACRVSRGDATEDMSMLVHPSSFTRIMDNFAEPIQHLVESIKKQAHNLDQSKFSAELRKIWEEDFVPTTRNIAAVQKREYLLPSFAEILKHVPRVILEIEVKTLHSGSKDTLQYFDKERPKRYIIVGGNKLSRGLTIEGLSVSYFLRNSTAYDTLLQMGRWFGYRAGYVDLTRLFMTPKARGSFADLAFVEIDLRDQFYKYSIEKIKPREMPPRILKVPSLMVTARNRMGAAEALEADFSDSLTQQSTFEFDQPDVIAHRNEAVIQFLKRLRGAKQLKEVAKLNRKPNTLVWRELLPTSELVNRLGSVNFGNLETRLLMSYLSEKMPDGRWLISVAGKSGDARPAGHFEFDGWSGDLLTVDRAVKTAATNNVKVVSSPDDIQALDAYCHFQKLDTDRVGYLIFYLLNPEPSALWPTTSGSMPPPQYLAAMPNFLAAPVFRVPKLARGEARIGLRADYSKLFELSDDDIKSDDED